MTILVVVGLLAVGGYSVSQQQQRDRAGTLLAAAMAAKNAEVVIPSSSSTGGEGDATWEQPPNTYPSEEARLEAALPKLLAAADGYPGTAQGITAPKAKAKAKAKSQTEKR